ncbi:MAG: hypothetical protein ABW143_02585, partial [Acidimicrobiales bacterium]
IGASASNPTGHWEVERLTTFNDRLLDDRGGRWSAPPSADRAELAGLAGGPWGDEAAELHAEAFAGTPWVWKDPRVSLLLPFWRAVLTRDGTAAPHEVVALRDPTEIAGSLAARDDLALAYGLALWERYTRTLLGDLDGVRACFVHYERLLAEPETVARELVAFCVDEPLSDEPDRLASVVDYLDGGHRHQTGVEDDVLSAAQAALDEALLGLSGPLEPFRAPSLPPETANLQLAFDESKRLSFFLEETDRLQAKVDALTEEHERQVAALHAEIEARSAEASDLAEQVMLLRAEADDYLRQLEELRGRFPIRMMTKAKGLLDRS